MFRQRGISHRRDNEVRQSIPVYIDRENAFGKSADVGLGADLYGARAGERRLRIGPDGIGIRPRLEPQRGPDRGIDGARVAIAQRQIETGAVIPIAQASLYLSSAVRTSCSQRARESGGLNGL